MSLISIDAILWRKMLAANFDSLGGISEGQYDIRLGRDPEVSRFFSSLSKLNQTALGGYEIQVPMAPFDGANPVPATDLRIKFMGPQSQRQDWNIPAQRPTTAYPLWRLDRGTPRNQSTENYIIIARDTRGGFHARWLDHAGIDALPSDLRSRLRSKDFGVTFMAADAANERAGQLVQKLKADHNVLLYGPPGTGKSQLMWEVAREFGKDPVQIDTRDEAIPLKGGKASHEPLVRWVTFHQSYGYEDFVVGLRPDPEAAGPLSLRAFPGVLLELAEHCRTTGGTAVLLIDEINRGNVSRIFGEFITLLEPDKRLAPDGSQTSTTVPLTLPYIDETTTVRLDSGDAPVKNPFMLPANIYLLASMNSVDRSVAPLDAALRRRFRIVNLDPNLDELRSELEANPPAGEEADIAEVERIRGVAIAVLQHLNEGISAFRGPDYRMGQWYLAGLIQARDIASARRALANTWTEKLLPHLEDIFHGRAEQLAVLLGGSNTGPLEFIEPSPEYEGAGARPFMQRRDLGEEATLAFLSALAAPAAPAVNTTA